MDKYTTDELFEWMNAQPDEKFVDMQIGCISRKGCLMGQFLKSKGHSGYVEANGRCRDGETLIDLKRSSIFDFFSYDFTVKNFGDLKSVFRLTPA